MTATTQSKLIRKISFQRVLEQTKEEKKAEDSLIASLSNYTTSSFDADSWILDRRSNKAHPNRIAFSGFYSAGQKATHIIKLFVIVLLNRGHDSSRTTRLLLKYFDFLLFNKINLKQIDKKIFGLYSFWIDEQKQTNGEPLNEVYKHKLFDSVLRFHSLMNGHSHITYIKGVEAIENPYNRNSSDSKYKVIDDYTFKILDAHFNSDTTPLHFRAAYWIMRLYATRPEDTVNYPLDCVKKISDDIATIKHAIVKNSKSNGGIDYNIEFLNIQEPMQKMLFELLKEQQIVSEKFQQDIGRKGFLFTYKNPSNNLKHILTTASLAIYIRNLQNQLSISKSKRAVPRDFKKTGITMRAEDGWTTPQLKHSANHRTYSSIDSYSTPSEDFMIKKQRDILVAQNKLSDRYVSKGKIINGIDVIFEKRLLENPRAHKIANLGFCPDVSGCGNHFECLDCESLVPDEDLKDYYIEQTDRYIKISEMQFEMGDTAKAKDSLHLATLFVSQYNKVTNKLKGDNDDQR